MAANKLPRMASAKRLGIGEAIGLILGLIGVGIQMLWPEQKWLGWVFIGLAAAVTLGVVTWAVAQHYALKGYNRGSPPLQTATAPAQTQTLETPINNSPIFAPVFAPEFNQSQSQTQKQTVVNKNDIVPPEVECTDCYFAKAKLSGWNRLTEDDLSGSACMAAQADFHLRPIPGSNPWIELRSQFEFYNSDGDRLKRVRDGVWREQGNWIQMPFNGGDTRTLVVALVSSEGFMTYEYSEHQSNRPRFTTTGIFHSFLPQNRNR